MGKASLLEKLSIHIASFETQSILEKDVVYMFIEIGKYLEHDKDIVSYPSINFFRNWISHPRKEKTSSIPDALKNAIQLSASHAEIEEVFIQTVLELRKDLVAFCKEKGLNTILEKDDIWHTYNQKLFGVLAEQPICFDQKLNRELEIDGAEGSFILIIRDSNREYKKPLDLG